MCSKLVAAAALLAVLLVEVGAQSRDPCSQPICSTGACVTVLRGTRLRCFLRCDDSRCRVGRSCVQEVRNRGRLKRARCEVLQGVVSASDVEISGPVSGGGRRASTPRGTGAASRPRGRGTASAASGPRGTGAASVSAATSGPGGRGTSRGTGFVVVAPVQAAPVQAAPSDNCLSELQGFAPLNSQGYGGCLDYLSRRSLFTATCVEACQMVFPPG